MSLLFSGMPLGGNFLLAAALVAHAVSRRPEVAPAFTLRLDGTWSVPAWEISASKPGRGSFQTPWIIRSALPSPNRGTRILLVPRDSVTPGQWRAIRALLG